MDGGKQIVVAVRLKRLTPWRKKLFSSLVVLAQMLLFLFPVCVGKTDCGKGGRDLW